ncbi:hypothetical protein [Variovorax ginsengisoli]|uniref:Uncharacterized protein n=1 Tax=Variovorax ginsengisoli TaxID=363844 RepID=A0ABT8SEQ3_9BURK|nr:hypothetical protein [Variovorax ginsengisoli]MDN8618090.1 hypothetical protein [Variovorax ginsengisoli]MDO1537260.1 hypothetical protein [Variovorax ginsengisoli]
MHALPPALAFALGLALADAGRPPGPGLHGPVLVAFDGDGAVEDVVEASGVAEAIAAIEHKTGAAGSLLVLLVPVAAGEWEATCAQASRVHAGAAGA